MTEQECAELEQAKQTVLKHIDRMRYGERQDYMDDMLAEYCKDCWDKVGDAPCYCMRDD